MEAYVALAAEKLFQIGPIPVTNSLVTTWIVTAILLVFAFFATKNIQMVPRGIQNIAELMVEQLQNLVISIAPDKVRIFLPVVASFFFFILFGNYFGLLPGVGSIGFYQEHHAAAPSHLASTEVPTQNHQESTTQTDENKTEETSHSTSQKVFVPYLRSINSDLNTTMALAIVSLFATHFLAIRFLGILGYIKKFININPIFLFVGFLEIIGEVTKILSLSFRLFGNIFAGEVLLTTATTRLFAFLVPIPFYFLEILVGFVQALIFTMLTLVFMVILTQKEAH